MGYRAVVIIAILNNVCHPIDAKLNVIPRDTEVKINDSTYLNCSTSLQANLVQWRHGRYYVYTGTAILEPYNDGRFSIEIDTSIGASNLVIRSVQPSDAGKYECLEDEGFGEKGTAELIVLDADPVCKSNVNPDGVIGPNSCDVRAEEISISCSITYHGNVLPILQWKANGDNESITGGFFNVTSSNNYVTYSLMIKSDLDINNSSFICQTTRTVRKPYTCSSNTINILYVFSSKFTMNMTLNDEVSCFVNTSQSCNYKWKWFSGDDISTESDNKVLKPKKVGWHRCEATCPFGNKSCTVESMQAKVYSDAATDRQNVMPLLALLLLPPLVVIGVIIYRRKKQKIEKEEDQRMREEDIIEFEKRKDALKTKLQQELEEVDLHEIEEREVRRLQELKKGQTSQDAEIRLLQTKMQLIQEQKEKQRLFDLAKEEELKIEVKQELEEEHRLGLNGKIDYAEKLIWTYGITTDASTQRREPINGVTILGEQLFVSRENSSVIEVYDPESFHFLRILAIEGMSHPMDIASCKIANCIYIIFREDSESESSITRLDPEGKPIKSWSTGGEHGRLSTYESNIIVCLFEKQVINEFNGDGNLIQTVRLSPAVGFNHPWHAIKVNMSHFAVCHGDAKDELHRVCIVDAHGNIKKELREWESKTKDAKLNVPICLVEDSERSILVVDRDSQTIRLLNCCLKLQRNLIKQESGLDGHPVRICLDETNSRLIVAANTLKSNKKEWIDGRILAFNVR